MIVLDMEDAPKNESGGGPEVTPGTAQPVRPVGWSGESSKITHCHRMPYAC